MKYERVDSMQIMMRPLRLVAVLCIAAVLASCSEHDHQDLYDYVNQVKARPAERIPPLPVFKPYETFEYSASSYRDPFRMFDHESNSVAVVDEKVSALLAEHENRNKETLEQYPLDTLKFVGQLERANNKWAIVTSPDNVVHRVKVGNYVGTNYGKIVRVDEEKIHIVEIIPDGMGGWIEREAALSLME